MSSGGDPFVERKRGNVADPQSRGHRLLRGIAASSPGVRCRGVGTVARQLPMGRDEAVRGIRRWVRPVPELDVNMRLGTHCYKHACTPNCGTSPARTARDESRSPHSAPNDAMVRFVEAMTSRSTRHDVEKLVGFYRVFSSPLRGHTPTTATTPQITMRRRSLDQLHPTDGSTTGATAR